MKTRCLLKYLLKSFVILGYLTKYTNPNCLFHNQCLTSELVVYYRIHPIRELCMAMVAAGNQRADLAKQNPPESHAEEKQDGNQAVAKYDSWDSFLSTDPGDPPDSQPPNLVFILSPLIIVISAIPICCLICSKYHRFIFMINSWKSRLHQF